MSIFSSYSKHARLGTCPKYGFTLLEILVAMTLLSLLIVLLMGLVDSATKLWRVNEKRVETYREARSALALIASDLANFYPSADPQHFMVDSGVDSGLGQIGFLAQLPSLAQETDDRSALCAVGYFLAQGRVSDIGPKSTAQGWHLYRYLLSSNETFQALRNSPASPNLFPESAFRPREIADPPRTEILARNVLRLVIRPLQQNGHTFREWTYSAENPLPEVLEIELVAVDNDFARRHGGDIRAESLGEENYRTWVTRVALPRAKTASAAPIAAVPAP
jgi:prepilin-type N-terminal cleavage/methylation domain-containing protein